MRDLFPLFAVILNLPARLGRDSGSTFFELSESVDSGSEPGMTGREVRPQNDGFVF